MGSGVGRGSRGKGTVPWRQIKGQQPPVSAPHPHPLGSSKPKPATYFKKKKKGKGEKALEESYRQLRKQNKNPTQNPNRSPFSLPASPQQHNSFCLLFLILPATSPGELRGWGKGAAGGWCQAHSGQSPIFGWKEVGAPVPATSSTQRPFLPASPWTPTGGGQGRSGMPGTGGTAPLAFPPGPELPLLEGWTRDISNADTRPGQCNWED